MAGVCLALRLGHPVSRFRQQGIVSCIKQGDTLFLTSSAYQQRHFCERPAEPAGSRRSADLPDLTLYTKTPCPLCDDALEALAPALHRVSLRKVDITLPENRRWYKLYRYDIPVFHFNNAFLMKHRGDLQVLLSALETWQASKA